jgi:L-serine dehydratase
MAAGEMRLRLTGAFMEFISILNDVLGPVMRGPSSSHTAGSYHIGRTARSLLGGEPVSATFTFDPAGSYARTYRQQGVDLALTAGLMGWSITDGRFGRALAIARKSGLRVSFRIEPLEKAEHPNTVRIFMASKSGGCLEALAKSTGGGGFQFIEVDDHPVDIKGKAHETVVVADRNAGPRLSRIMAGAGRDLERPFRRKDRNEILISWRKDVPAGADVLSELRSVPGVGSVRVADPVFLVRKGEPLFLSAEEMVRTARRKRLSLGETALLYESRLLGLSEDEVLTEILRRYGIMKASVERGMKSRGLAMQLLRPSAGRVLAAERLGKTAVGGIHARAAARAMAAMHVSDSAGIVCAAPTGGAAGTLPGVVVTLSEETRMGERQTAMMLLAASAVGLIVARRATFAAEVAGCQVEIGAAGAMAAAAVVEFAGGSARQAADAAAISFQNTMGSVCDLV